MVVVVLVGGMRAVKSTFCHLRSCFECECVVLFCGAGEGAAGVRVLRARERKKQTAVSM